VSFDKMEENLHDLEQTKALNEIKDASKDVSKAFLFGKGNILAKDEQVKEEEAKKTIEAFEEINERANVIDGIRSITIQGANGRVDITRINDYFLTTVASKEATDENMNNLTRVLAPSIINRTKEKTQSIKQPPNETAPQSNLEQKQTVETAPSLSSEQTESTILDLPEPEFTEFTVDQMGRLDVISASHDIVRLDMITVGRWTDLYGEKKIRRITLKSPSNGKTIQCKFEPIKESKDSRRDTALIPEMLLRILQIKKGSKVLIKPVIEQEPPEQAVEVANVEKQPEEHTMKEFLPDSPACQLIVQDLSGFGNFMGEDKVRFDGGLVERWREFYGQEKIEEVTINDILLGKSVRCKFKIQKDSEFEGKGRIQIPKLIRQKLMVKEGSLVTIKPVVK
jgi:hypothetical protein